MNSVTIKADLLDSANAQALYCEHPSVRLKIERHLLLKTTVSSESVERQCILKIPESTQNVLLE